MLTNCTSVKLATCPLSWADGNASNTMRVAGPEPAGMLWPNAATFPFEKKTEPGLLMRLSVALAESKDRAEMSAPVV